MKRSKRKLALRPDTVRALAAGELRRAVGGVVATSEANDGYPCPGEYSWRCSP